MTVALVNEQYQVTVHGRLEGQECLNVIAFKCINGASNIEDQLLLALIQCLVETLIPKLSLLYTLERVTCKQVYPILGPELERLPDVGMALTGATAGDGLPSHDSFHLSIHTTRGGRSGRGRMYFGGIPETQTVGSLINTETPLWPAIIAFVACVAGKFLGNGFNPAQRFQLGVISRKIGGAKPPFIEAGFAPCTNIIPHREIGTTRSRKVGHGS